MRVDLLTQRALNRATLARQLLLERSTMPVLDAVAHLVGMQAQVPLNPYAGLWSRLVGFRPDDLSRLLLDREVVRIVCLRGTLHLVTADDCLVLRPLAQPVLDREMANHPQHGPALAGVDLEPVLAEARLLLAERPRTGPQLRAALTERFPGLDGAALAFACRNRLAFVQVPPRGVWGRGGAVTGTTAEAWLGRPLAAHPSIDEVVLRYFAAYGPASAGDVAAWSRLTGMREVVDRLGPRLRTFRDEAGRELHDVPDGIRPDPDTPAPTRFLPEYDNVLLSHADRTRFLSAQTRALLSGGAVPVRGTVLHDGAVRGAWQIDRDGDSGRATLVIDHVGPLTKRAGAAVAAEGRRFVRFMAADAGDHDVRLVPVG